MRTRIAAAVAALLTIAFLPTTAEARRGPASSTFVDTCIVECGPRAEQSGRTNRRVSKPVRAAKVHKKPEIIVKKPADGGGPETVTKAEVKSPGVVRAKSGAVARVKPDAAPKFQQLVNWLESKGYPVKFMGGYRPGPCWTGGMHPCGEAIDINQTARGRVVAAFPAGTAAYARTLGIVSGSSWCNDDTGHFQIGGHEGCNPLALRRVRAQVAALQASRAPRVARARPHHHRRYGLVGRPAVGIGRRRLVG